MSIKKDIEAIYQDPSRLEAPENQKLVMDLIEGLDQGKLRVAEKDDSGNWQVNGYLKMAILLYFRLQKNIPLGSPPFEYFDKIPVKNLDSLKGVRVVPGAVARKACFIEEGAILMPSLVNIGAYVASGSMVDTWATVGSCAQVGKGVHLSGGVGLGGVLEPPQAEPVIIEDNAFIGSRCIVVEGVKVGEGAVLGANTVLTASTKIIDVTGSQPQEVKGHIPARKVVIPGTRTKKFPAGEFQVPCALIIGERSSRTDEKTSLNDALREFDISV